MNPKELRLIKQYLYKSEEKLYHYFDILYMNRCDWIENLSVVSKGQHYTCLLKKGTARIKE